MGIHGRGGREEIRILSPRIVTIYYYITQIFIHTTKQLYKDIQNIDYLNFVSILKLSPTSYYIEESSDILYFKFDEYENTFLSHSFFSAIVEEFNLDSVPDLYGLVL